MLGTSSRAIPSLIQPLMTTAMTRFIPTTTHALAVACCLATSFGADSKTVKKEPEKKDAVKSAAPAEADKKEGHQPIPIAKIKHPKAVDFEKEILPILRAKCLACHNETTAEEKLVLETPKDILKGGDSGPAAKARKSAASLLIQLGAQQKKPYMPPPKNKVGAKDLTPEELGLIAQWIDEGAKGEVKGAGPIVWQPLPPGLNPIYAVALTQDGQFAAAGRADQIFIYHVPSSNAVTRLVDPAMAKIPGKGAVAHRDMVHSLAFNPDGTLLASGDYRQVKLWKRPATAQKAKLPGGAEKSFAVTAASPDGQWLAAAGDDNSIKIWNLATGKSTKTLSKHSAPVTGLKFTPDSARLISGSTDKSVRVWTVADGALFAEAELPAEVNAVTWAADAKQVAAGCADNLIRVLKLPDAAGGKLDAVKELKGHTKSVTSLDTVTTNGVQLLSGSADGNVTHWDLEKGTAIRSMAHGSAVTSVAARPDGKFFASAAGTNVAAKLWNAADGKLVADLKGDRYAQETQATRETDAAFAVTEVTFRKAAQKSAEDAQKQRDDAAKKTGDEKDALAKTLPEKKKAVDEAKAKQEPVEKELEPLKAAETKAKDAKDSNDKIIGGADAGTKAATNKVAMAKAGFDKLAADKKSKAKDKETAAKALADAEKAVAELTAKIKAANESKTNLDKAFADAAAAAKTVNDKLAPLTKAFTDAIAEVKKYTTAEENLALAQAQAKKAAGVTAAAKADVAKAEETQKKADADSAAAKKAATDAEKPVRIVAFSPDNRTLATAGDDGMVRTWSAETGAPFEVFRGHTGAVASLAFTSAATLASGSTDKSAVVWDLNPPWTLERVIGTGEPGSPLSGRVNALDFSPDGKLLATGSGDPSRSGQLKIWNVADGTLAHDLKNAHSDTVQGVDFSPDGTRLVSGAADKFVKVWDLAEGKLVKSFEGHTHQVLGVSFRREGRTVASASADNNIKVWSLDTGEGKRTIAGATKEVTSLCYVGASDQFVATSGDNLVRLVAEGGNTVRSFPGSTDFVYSAAVKPDGRLVIAGGQDSVLRMWNGASGALLAAFSPPVADPISKPPPPKVEPETKKKKK